MKVLIINGSPRTDGNTTVAVNELVRIFEAEGIETEVCQIGNKKDTINLVLFNIKNFSLHPEATSINCYCIACSSKIGIYQAPE